MEQDRLSGQNVAVGIRLADGARFLVFRTPVDEARMALTEVSAALDDRSLHSLLGDRSAEILGLFEVERTKIRAVIAEFDRQAAEQLRNRRN